MTPDQVFAEYLAMKPGLGWVHIKDYRTIKQPQGCPISMKLRSRTLFQGYRRHCHEAILRDLATELPKDRQADEEARCG